LAGDWLPVRLDLPEDPAVVSMAGTLGVSIPTVVGGLIGIWSWWSRQSRSGHAAVTLAYLDRHGDVPGLARAMVAAGWLRDDGNGEITVPKWDRWMSHSAKDRLNAARRQASKRTRDKAKPVTPMSRSARDENVTTGQDRTGQVANLTPTLPVAGKGDSCGYCGATAAQVGRAHQLDHILPRAAGGADDPSNLTLACYRCNQAKASRVFGSIEEARAWLHRAFWTSNRRRWIDHRRHAFGGKPPPGIDPATAPNGVSGHRNIEAEGAWSLVTDAINATADNQQRSARVGARTTHAVEACGGWTALGRMDSVKAHRAFTEAYKAQPASGSS